MCTHGLQIRQYEYNQHQKSSGVVDVLHHFVKSTYTCLDRGNSIYLQLIKRKWVNALITPISCKKYMQKISNDQRNLKYRNKKSLVARVKLGTLDNTCRWNPPWPGLTAPLILSRSADLPSSSDLKVSPMGFEAALQSQLYFIPGTVLKLQLNKKKKVCESQRASRLTLRPAGYKVSNRPILPLGVGDIAQFSGMVTPDIKRSICFRDIIKKCVRHRTWARRAAPSGLVSRTSSARGISMWLQIKYHSSVGDPNQHMWVEPRLKTIKPYACTGVATVLVETRSAAYV